MVAASGILGHPDTEATEQNICFGVLDEYIIDLTWYPARETGSNGLKD